MIMPKVRYGTVQVYLAVVGPFRDAWYKKFARCSFWMFSGERVQWALALMEIASRMCTRFMNTAALNLSRGMYPHRAIPGHASMSEDSSKAKFLSMFVARIARGCCHRQSHKVLRHNHGLLSGMQASSTVDSGGRFINRPMHAGHGPVHMFLRNRRISGVLGAIPSQLLPAGISREIACKPYALNCKDLI